MSAQAGCPPVAAQRKQEASHVNVLKKLQHPAALIVQGFIVGGVLFWTTQGQANLPAPAAPAAISAPISAN
jgi:hypothetical protein